MKLQSLNLIACLLLIGGIDSSCNSCNKKDPRIDSSPEQVTVTDTSANSGYQDAASDANGIANAQMNAAANASGSKAATAKSKANSSKTKDKKGNKLSGYGAPDGTDAENHDGDQYTRNDTTRMPNGPIK